MVLHYIWVTFFLVAFLTALIRTLGYVFHEQLFASFGWVFDKADGAAFEAVMKSTFSMAETSVSIAIFLIGVMTLWLGIMKIGENGGAVEKLAKLVSPLFSRLFPDVPRNHPAIGAMVMNISANMLGLDNAATPLGLKAMDELQSLNKDKEKASNSQIMFLVLNTSGLTLVPVSVMAIRAAEGAANPADVFLPILITTFCSTLAGLIAVSFFQKINLFNWIILTYVGAISLVIGSLAFVMFFMSQESMGLVSSAIGNSILLSLIILFILLGLRKKINIYDSFIEGAKSGFEISIKIIPYLIAMLVAIGVLRASGALDLIIDGIRLVAGLFTDHTEWVETLPTAIMKPLSGSGARGMMVEAIHHSGVDSLVGKTVSVMQGSTETTFYTLAVYFGAVGVKHTRHAVSCGLIADVTAIIVAIIIGYQLV